MVSDCPYRFNKGPKNPTQELVQEALHPKGSQSLRTMESGWEAFLAAFPALAKLSLRKPVGLHP